MQQIEYRKTYQEYKAELDTELNRTAEGFVRIGYLLKVARDTDILRESGYSSVTEFARAEYDIDKSQVSRFIHINDKFAEGGYSDRLQEQYQGFGYAKLTLMLQLPDAVNEELSPSYSKAEIQMIKEEVDAEGEVTDLEVMMEPEPTFEITYSTLHAAVYQLGEDDPELYSEVAAVQDIRELQEVMAPDGERTYSIRIPRTGRIMIILSDSSDNISIVNVRTGERETASWEELYAAWQQLLDGDGSPEHWEKTYGKEYPKEEPEELPVAPVQPKPEKSKKVVKAKTEKEKNRINTKSESPSKPTKEPQEESAEQTDTALDVPKEPEAVPEETKTVSEETENVSKEEESVPEETENIENTKCEAVLGEPQEVTESEAKDLLTHIYNTYGTTISKNFKDDCVREAFDMAISALEKQIPKKPDYEGDGYSDGKLVYDTWICPNCSKRYEVDYDNHDYCPYCGQHIDLSKEEDEESEENENEEEEYEE